MNQRWRFDLSQDGKCVLTPEPVAMGQFVTDCARQISQAVNEREQLLVLQCLSVETLHNLQHQIESELQRREIVKREREFNQPKEGV